MSYLTGQLKALSWLRQRRWPGGALALMDIGTGKTVVGRDWAIPLAIGGHALIICRPDDILTWKQHTYGVDGCMLREVVEEDIPGQFNIVTYDQLKKESIQRYILGKLRPYACIADEIQQIKHHDTERARAFHKVTWDIPCRLGMTGTVITNEPSDLFSIGLFADHGKTFGTSYWAFMNKYYLKAGFEWALMRDAKERIAADLKRIAIVVTRAESGVPIIPKDEPIIAVDMTAAQQKYYKQVFEDLEIQVDGGKYEIDHVTTQIGKLHQISSGFLYLDDTIKCPVCDGTGYNHYTEDFDDMVVCEKCKGGGKVVIRRRQLHFPSNKISLAVRLAVKDYADRSKLVYWCRHIATIYRLQRELTKAGVTSTTFHGSRLRENNAARVAFRDDPKLRCFIGQVDKGVGMNELICADTAIYVENSDKAVSRKQSSGRTDRKGSERHKKLYVVDLVTQGTMDLAVLRTIKGMGRFTQNVLNLAKQGVKLREIISRMEA